MGGRPCRSGKETLMLHIAAEQEHYCLLTDGTAWTIADRPLAGGR